MTEHHPVFAETLTTPERKAAHRSIIFSACLSSSPSIMLSNSAIIMVFVSMLGMTDTFKMFTSSMEAFSTTLLLIPCAFLADRVGWKRLLHISTIIATISFVVLGMAPWFYSYAKTITWISCAIFAMSSPLFNGAWMPLIDGVILKEERGAFFSKLRVTWQTCCMSYIFLIGYLIGNDPPIWLLQIIIMVTGIISYFRIIFVRKIPEAPSGLREKRPEFFTALRTSASNAPLSGFSVYLFCLNLASQATIPLTYVYLISYLNVSEDTVVIISSLTLAGTIFGCWIGGPLLKIFGTRNLLLCIHFAYAAVNLTLFALDLEAELMKTTVTALLVFYGTLVALASIIITVETFALARPGNKAMAIAFCSTFVSAGSALSRSFTSLAIGSGILAPVWAWGGREFTHFQTIYLVCGVAILLACMMLVLVPAVVPKNDNYYEPS